MVRKHQFKIFSLSTYLVIFFFGLGFNQVLNAQEELTKEEKNVYKTRAKELNERPAADLTESEMQLDRTALFKDIQKKVSV